MEGNHGPQQLAGIWRRNSAGICTPGNTMFWRIPAIIGGIQAANAQAQIANAYEAQAREFCAEQERIQNQQGALNLVERDGVYVLPDLVS